METKEIQQSIDSSSNLIKPRDVRAYLLEGREIALLDVREEAQHAEGHPLFAANLPFSRLELDVYARLPRRTVSIAVFDDGGNLAMRAAGKLQTLGYTNVSLLEGGLQGWRDAGYEVFRDVNAPSKAFGELVEDRRHTPSLSAQEVKKLIDAQANIAIVDVRRFDEFHTMSIPTATSVPGGELALRLRELAPDPKTQIIVNCAGRTRGIIGTQSLINVGLPNKVSALRNGTIGWALASQELDHGQTKRFPEVGEKVRAIAAAAARGLANKAGVLRTRVEEVEKWLQDADITIYRFDVRTPDEYEKGHLQGYRNAPGGQLVQETDMFAPVRNGRIVLLDDDGVRANMSASWLAQMGWEVFVVDGVEVAEFTVTGEGKDPLALILTVPEYALIEAPLLHEWLNEDGIVILDFARSPEYAKQHIVTSWFASRSNLDEVLTSISYAKKIVLTSPGGVAAKLAWFDIAKERSKIPTLVLTGGTKSWVEHGFSTDNSNARYACRPIDRYLRPYEGNDVTPEAMQAYLDWEYGLVKQLERDGTHRFRVI
jgi:rhodanese-related sulfurtransferase